MTPNQREIISAMQKVKTLQGTFDKRFMRSLESKLTLENDNDITPKQEEWMYRLLYKYRKQVPNTYSKYQKHPYCTRLTSTKQ